MTASNSDLNRRANFRIDDLLAASVQKVAAEALPTPRIIPVALAEAGKISGSLRFLSHDDGPAFALLLIEANAKLDRLLEFYRLPRYNEEKDFKPSLGQILLQISTKLDKLLDFHNISRDMNAPRVGEVSLSAGGIRLTASEDFAVGDAVEVHLLLSSGEPCWVVTGGSVVRVEPLPEGGCRVAVEFSQSNAAIRDAIATYALKKQKEQLIGQRWLKEG